MTRPLSVHPFSSEEFLGLLGPEAGHTGVPDYLGDYLRGLGAAEIVAEPHYVDRHYVDAFAHYYSRSFKAPVAYCRRFHFFRRVPNDGGIERLLEAVWAGKHSLPAAEMVLQEHYLGFVVVRPLVGATIGRTVLRPPAEDDQCRFPVVRPYRVHLGGLRLEVTGLAYQEQDGGVAVCASTALWSALQCVAFVALGRAPTPSAITGASGSPYPASHGLDDQQMARAVSALGFIADKFEPQDDRDGFRAKVAACLRSRLPVILILSPPRAPPGAGQDGASHAITLAGFREPEWRSDPLEGPDVASVNMKDESLKTVYAHDDNLGPYAVYELFDGGEKNQAGNEQLMIRCPSTSDEWVVELALVAKPAGLRLAIGSLMSDVLAVRRLFEWLGEDEVHFEARFASGVAYKRSLLERRLDPRDGFDPLQMAEFQRRASFPRHVGVVTIFHGREPLIDVVLDVSEVERTFTGNHARILALVGYCPADSEAGYILEDVTTSRGGVILRLTRPPQQPGAALHLQAALATVRDAGVLPDVDAPAEPPERAPHEAPPGGPRRPAR